MVEAILKELNELGVGYTTSAQCEEDTFGVELSWSDIKNTPIELLEDMLSYWRN